MPARPRWELRGRGWTLSLQRSRACAEPGRSSNLGAAALVPLGRGPARRAAARLARDERLWIAVTAPSGVKVEARLADGRVLDDEILGDGGEGPAVHRLMRIAGEAQVGVGREDAVTVDIGACSVGIEMLCAEEFEARFGPAGTVEGDPAVYEGWRLP
jgi:hypothetical protein